MKKAMSILFLIIVGVAIALFVYYKTAAVPAIKPITWGVDFSQMQATALQLDWKKTYLAILDDLEVKYIKLHTQWDFVETDPQEYFFDDIDWQVQQAGQRGVKLIYVVGMKTGRWPECHIPAWAVGLSKEEQQARILAYVRQVVERYKDNPAIGAWQAENEPLFVFGQCPWYDKEFLKKEVALIKSLDPSHQVLVSDSGEQSLWFGAARIGDKVGVTTYRTVWVHITSRLGFYFTFPMPPAWYGYKARLVHFFFKKEVIGVELQAEPWTPRLFYDVPLAEQEKSMNLKKFQEAVQYAKKTGLDTFYLWGVEWHYWMKTTQNRPEIWNEAKKLFSNQI